MTVTYRNNASDVWHTLAYLATRTVPGWLFLAFMLICPLAGPAIVFFSTPPGTKIEPIAVMTSLLVFGAVYAIFALYVLLGVYLSAWIMPKLTITLEPERCCMTSVISLKAPWRSFERIVDEPDFYCFFGWRSPVFIP
ncbi:MAG: hypothetical protein M3Y27_28235, partial [Acidobacteriota bacterium]|nr:hypothetical protein [Acidobacteriota bacterium]